MIVYPAKTVPGASDMLYIVSSGRGCDAANGGSAFKGAVTGSGSNRQTDFVGRDVHSESLPGRMAKRTAVELAVLDGAAARGLR